MEYFPAASEAAWDHIARVIDDSDYYVLIVGNRYGSIDDSGLSYTEREFDYALSKDIPVLAFLHAEPDAMPVNRSDIEPDARRKLQDFRVKVGTTLLTQSWTTPDELALHIATSLTSEMQIRPQPGWIRGDSDPAQRLPKTTSHDVQTVSEVLTISKTAMKNDMELRIRALTSGFEVFHRTLAGSGGTRFESIETIGDTGNVLYPLVDLGDWKKAFIHVGRQLMEGEEVSVAFRETYVPDYWERDNQHGYFVGHSVERVHLSCVFPAELAPTHVWKRVVSGESDHGDLVWAEEVEIDQADPIVINFNVDEPQIGHNYAIEWQWSEETLTAFEGD